MTIEKKTIIETRGRKTKYSSKVYVVKIETREANDLDKWFGATDPVKRSIEYQKS